MSRFAGVVAFSRSAVGRITIASIGLGIVVLVLRHAGPERVWASIRRAAFVLPVLFVGEGVFSFLELWALRSLYGPDRHKLPTAEVLRAGLVANAIGGLMPAGRPVIEGMRGAALARWTNGARATAAGTKVQAILLLTQAAVCIPCAAGAAIVRAPAVLPLALLANGLFTGGIGTAMYLATRRGKLGKRLAKLTPRAKDFGPALDRYLLDEKIPREAVLFTLAARGAQLVQYTVLLTVFIGGWSVLRGLCALGVHMVGATIGDFIPTHLGGTEAISPISAQTLSISQSDAIAIPLVIHAEQLMWIVIGLLVSVFWPRRVPATPPSALAEPAVAVAVAESRGEGGAT